MLRILSWNCRGFPWNKGPKLSWISNEVDIIFLVETWEHAESRVPNIDGFVLWSIWNKRSSRRGIGGIACYIKKNISPHARLYKKDPHNQYMWIEITDINNRKTYIAICYFAPINSNFYKKNNLDKNCPYNGLENDISRFRNEGNILLMGDFNARTSNNQAILLSNYSNPNPLWLDEDLTLASRYKRSSVDLGENLFGSELIKLCSSQDLIICNGLTKWPSSSQMTCIHGLGSSVVDYVISDISLYNDIINLDVLNDHEPDSDHKPLMVTLNYAIHRDPIEDNPYNQKELDL